MSVEMDQAADAILLAAGQAAAAEEGSLDELSDVEVDGDGSSSLSDIEDKDGEGDEDGGASDVLSDVSDEENEEIEEIEENDSEAETERLEESPNKFCPQQDVVPSSQNIHHTYQPSPSKLNRQIHINENEDDEDDEPLSDEDVSDDESPESPKSPTLGEHKAGSRSTATPLHESAGEGRKSLSIMDAESKKRKRSIMGGGALDDDSDEPLRKRTGSVLTGGDDFAIEDDPQPDEDVDTSNPISGDVSGDEAQPAHGEDVPDEVDDPIAEEQVAPDLPDVLLSPKKRGRRKQRARENGLDNHEDENMDVVVDAVLNGDSGTKHVDDEPIENEGDDEAEAALKNEEELEKKRVALDQLTNIERQFTTFRDRLYNERLELLNREEAMLRLDKPTHPEYLAMMECIDARRDSRFRVADNLRELEMETLRRTAVARRSQALTQYQQDVRRIREVKLEELGKQWYEIQHDRRSYAGSVPDYALKFPTRKSQQIMNQVAYSNEVSILSGIAKYVGFPAAPPMAGATDKELEDDFRQMGRVRQVPQGPPAGLVQELAALRTMGSTNRFKPAEEQFIEQTPWANPQHPMHLLQRQTSAQQAPRNTSPFSQIPAPPRRNSAMPISGTFSSSGTSLHHHTSNGVSMSGGRVSPHNPFGNSNHSHTIAPSPLGSRQPSLSPQQNRHPPSFPDQPNQPQHTDTAKINGAHNSPLANHGEVPPRFS